MKIAISLVWMLALCAFAARADAVTVTLYGATAAGSAGELYRINPATGAVIQDVGPLNDVSALNYGMTGMAFHPVTGVLYGSTHNSDAADAATRARLVTINPATAQVTVIGQFNAGNSGVKPATMTDLAFDAAGNLYGLGSNGGAHLYSINSASGQATLVGNSGLSNTSGGGLEFGPSATLYGTPTSTQFGTYNTTTGAYSNIANPTKPVGGAYGALTYDGSNLYGLNLGPGPTFETHLVTINPGTGVVTDIASSVTSLDAIAVLVGIIGDYNGNRVVDGADYVVWRDTFGQSAAGLPADGDNDGTIDNDDYGVWRGRFGNTTNPASAAAVPEPSSIAIAMCCACLLTMRRKKHAN